MMLCTKTFKLSSLALLGVLFVACGQPEQLDRNGSVINGFLEGGGWAVADSPFGLEPGTTIAVCDTGVKEGVQKYVMEAVSIWLKAGKRDERIKVVDGCDGTRVVRLVKAPAGVSYYGQASPLNGNSYRLDVPPHWANHWTANHEVGHVFGFAHIFNGVTSIMNSENNGQFMNEGQLAKYDFSEVVRMLKRSEFTRVNALWSASDDQSSDIYAALDTDTSTDMSDLYISVSESVASVAVCEDESIEVCKGKVAKLALLSSPSATRNARKFFKTGIAKTLTHGKKFAILTLDKENTVLKATSVQVEKK